MKIYTHCDHPHYIQPSSENHQAQPDCILHGLYHRPLFHDAFYDPLFSCLTLHIQTRIWGKPVEVTHFNFIQSISYKFYLYNGVGTLTVNL